MLQVCSLTGSGSVVADTEAAVGDLGVADELQVESIAVRANDSINRRAAVLANQRRRSESSIPGSRLHKVTFAASVSICYRIYFLLSDLMMFVCFSRHIL